MSQLVEHFFRHEYGRLVAVLLRRVGAVHLEDVEDAVQSALMKALDVWTNAGEPDNPSAWLFRVAQNNLIGELRKKAGRHDIILQQSGEQSLNGQANDSEDLRSPEEDLLQMLFVCCDEDIPLQSQLVFALKILCGFGVREIALRLFISESNVYKRLSRARDRLRKNPPRLEAFAFERSASRLPAVHKILYVLFTEGYQSAHPDRVIRQELCDEALRLAMILADHPVGQVPETCALIALMHLHMARMSARLNGSGGLLLLEEQDRSLWDQNRIQEGFEWLAEGAEGDTFSRYHAEAGIAAEHCLAPSFQETRWDKIVECYELLEQVAPSALHRLNRVVAVAEWRGPREGLAILKGFEPPTWLLGSYLWVAVLADLHHRNGDIEIAERYRADALELAPTPAVKDMLERRLQSHRSR